MKKITIAFLLLTIISCTQTKKESEALNLNTFEEKEQYLLQLFNDDQKYRNSAEEASIKFGYHSEQHKSQLELIIKQDSINFENVTTYLATYGYPSCKEFEELACVGMVYIVGHSGKFEKQKMVFKYFRDAYHSEKLDRDSFLFLLNEMHESKYGYLYDFKNEFTFKERIQILIDFLKLEESS